MGRKRSKTTTISNASGLPAEIWEDLMRKSIRQFEIMNDLTQAMPWLPFIGALVMAGDMAHGELIEERVKKGALTVKEAIPLLGSYVRFPFAVRNLPDEELFPRLPDLWVSSDPDDTKVEYLQLWRRAFKANKNRIIKDNPNSRLAGGMTVQLFRGQRRDDPLGIAWSTDPHIAHKFAKGAGVRGPISGGTVISITALKDNVIAYLTERGEWEVILDIEAEGLVRIDPETNQFISIEGVTKQCRPTK